MNTKCKDCVYFVLDGLQGQLGFCGLCSSAVSDPFAFADDQICDKFEDKEGE